MIGGNTLVYFRCCFVYKYTVFTLASVDLWPMAREPPVLGVVRAFTIHYAHIRNTSTHYYLFIFSYYCFMLFLPLSFHSSIIEVSALLA